MKTFPAPVRRTLAAASVIAASLAFAPIDLFAQLSPGDIVVVDISANFDASTAGEGAVVRVDPVTGMRTVLSDFGNPAQGPLGGEPKGLAIEPSGSILVGDSQAGTQGLLFRVNPATGTRTVVSDGANPAQGVSFGYFHAVAIEASGSLLVTGVLAPAGSGALIRINPVTGMRTLVSNFENPAQGPFGSDDHLIGVTVESTGKILVLDEGQNHRLMFRVDPVTGNRVVLSALTNPGQGPTGGCPTDVAIESSGTLLVADKCGGIGPVLFRVDSLTGTRSVLSNFQNPNQGPIGSSPNGVAILPSGTVLVPVVQVEVGTSGALFKVNPVTGNRTILSDFRNPAQGPVSQSQEIFPGFARPGFNTPFRAAVVPGSSDTTPPVITAASPITIEATGPAGAVVTFSATAVDAISGPAAVTATPASGTTFALGLTSVLLSATDAAGNTATKSILVNVVDTTAPALSLPGSLTAEATGPAGAAVSFSASATDVVSGSVAVSLSPASGSTFTLGTTTVNATTSDAALNTATGSFTVTVRDTTAPVLVLPANQVLEATSAAGATATFVANATDVVGVASLTYSHASGSTFALGTTTVVVTAADAAGNSTSGLFTVSVRDTTAPVIAAVANVVAEATSAAGATVAFSASASDIVSGAVAVGASPASGSTFAIGTTSVTLSAIDAAGNTATRTFTVTVRDTTAPVLALPANQVLEATSAAGATATFAASATDAVGVTSLTSSAASGSTFPIGTTTVTFTAIDAAGNTTWGSFTITVRDTTAPTITSLSTNAPTLWPPNHKMVAVTLNSTVNDAVGVDSSRIVSATSNEPDDGLGDGDTAGDIEITGAMTLNLRAERSGNGNGRVYSITVEASDAAGNTSTRTVTVSVPKNQAGN
jgi:hypothetical protein